MLAIPFGFIGLEAKALLGKGGRCEFLAWDLTSSVACLVAPVLFIGDTRLVPHTVVYTRYQYHVPAKQRGEALFSNFCGQLTMTFYMSGLRTSVRTKGKKEAGPGLNAGTTRNMSDADCPSLQLRHACPGRWSWLRPPSVRRCNVERGARDQR